MRITLFLASNATQSQTLMQAKLLSPLHGSRKFAHPLRESPMTLPCDPLPAILALRYSSFLQGNPDVTNFGSSRAAIWPRCQISGVR
jgi:hypothetical protein